MSYKVYRGHSNEAGNFDTDGAICNIDTQMSMGVIDWSKSYVLFYHALNITNNPVSVHNIVLMNSNAYLPSESIVKRYRKSFDKAGVVCDVKDVNVYSANIKQFALDAKEKEVQFHPMLEKDNTGGTEYFTRKQNIGTTKSTYERYPLKVMLKDLDGFNQVATECDLSKFGNCKDFFELNKGIFNPQEVIRFPASTYLNGIAMANYTNAAAGDKNFGTDIPLVIPKTAVTPDMFFPGALIVVKSNNDGAGVEWDTGIIDTVDDSEIDTLSITLTADLFVVATTKSVTDITVAPKIFEVVTNNTGGPLDVTQLVYSREVDLSEIPFYVGQALFYRGFNDTTPIPANEFKYITGISYDETTRKATVTFNDKLGTVADTKDFDVDYIGDVPLSHYNPPPVLSTSIVEVEMVLYSKNMTTKGSQQIDYITTQSQRFNMYGNDHQDTFELEPNCFNFMIMQPSLSALVSNRNNLTNYRLRLDGEDLTNRDVTVDKQNRQLQNDRLNMTFQNAGIPLRTLNSTNPQPLRYRTLKTQILNNSNDIVYPLNPVPLTERNKMLQVRLQGTGALNQDGILFKQLSRTIQG